jgi:hypothetical protein
MKIYRGQQTPEHKGDTSRELLDMWQESGYCEIIDGETQDMFIWANEPGDVLLYEYDRYDVYPSLPSHWKHGLFGGMQHRWPNAHSWIYWARRPRKLEAKIENGIKPYGDREIESIFLGKVENRVQLASRTAHDWSTTIELFSMPITMGDSFKWPYTQDEYLEKVANTKFGLCLPGYGPKCNREIEYFGLGVVPVITERVCTAYHDPLIEGLHYLKANTPLEAQQAIKGCSEAKWQYLSHHGREWYERNCSRLGSFETTKRIVESLK